MFSVLSNGIRAIVLFLVWDCSKRNAGWSLTSVSVGWVGGKFVPCQQARKRFQIGRPSAIIEKVWKPTGQSSGWRDKLARPLEDESKVQRAREEAALPFPSNDLQCNHCEQLYSSAIVVWRSDFREAFGYMTHLKSPPSAPQGPIVLLTRMRNRSVGGCIHTVSGAESCPLHTEF